MLDRQLATATERSVAEVDFQQWRVRRYRGRALRLTWALVALLLAAIATVAILSSRLDDATQDLEAASQRYETTAQELDALDQRFREVAVNLRTADRRMSKLAACLESRVVRVTGGLHQLLGDRISIKTYLRRYEPVGCP